MESGHSKIIDIPNLLSISRIVISPLLFIAIKNNSITWIIILAAWALLSDFFDGFIARKMNRISQAGKILDPLADKVCLASGALALTIYGDLPFSLLALVLARDIIIAMFGIAIIKKIKVIPVSNIIGKFTVFFISLAMLIYIFKFERYYDAAYITAIAAIITSSGSYLLVGIKLFSNKT